MVLLIKLVVFDLDNVIIDGEAIDEIGKLANVEEDIDFMCELVSPIEVKTSKNIQLLLLKNSI